MESMREFDIKTTSSQESILRNLLAQMNFNILELQDDGEHIEAVVAGPTEYMASQVEEELREKGMSKTSVDKSEINMKEFIPSTKEPGAGAMTKDLQDKHNFHPEAFNEYLSDLNAVIDHDLMNKPRVSDQLRGQGRPEQTGANYSEYMDYLVREVQEHMDTSEDKALDVIDVVTTKLEMEDKLPEVPSPDDTKEDLATWVTAAKSFALSKFICQVVNAAAEDGMDPVKWMKQHGVEAVTSSNVTQYPEQDHYSEYFGSNDIVHYESDNYDDPVAMLSEGLRMKDGKAVVRGGEDAYLAIYQPDKRSESEVEKVLKQDFRDAKRQGMRDWAKELINQHEGSELSIEGVSKDQVITEFMTVMEEVFDVYLGQSVEESIGEATSEELSRPEQIPEFYAMGGDMMEMADEVLARHDYEQDDAAREIVDEVFNEYDPDFSKDEAVRFMVEFLRDIQNESTEIDDDVFVEALKKSNDTLNEAEQVEMTDQNLKRFFEKLAKDVQDELSSSNVSDLIQEVSANYESRDQSMRMSVMPTSGEKINVKVNIAKELGEEGGLVRRQGVIEGPIKFAFGKGRDTETSGRMQSGFYSPEGGLVGDANMIIRTIKDHLQSQAQ